LWIYFIVTGCSITKKGVNNSSGISVESGNEDIIALIEKQNLTSSNFFLQKAEVEVIKEGESESFIASIKYDTTGSYLISLRGKSGIEAARIYVTADTVVINDRINRQLLFGKPGYLEKKFRIPLVLFPVVFGDLISGSYKTENVSSCVNGTLNIDRNIQGVGMRYLVDCKKRKIISASRVGIINSELAELKFDKFISYGKGFFPSVIHINYMDSQIYIKIMKLELPWEGRIEFIPGNKYELIELL